MKTLEMKFKVPNGPVIEAKVMHDGSCMLTIEREMTPAEAVYYTALAQYGISMEEGKDLLDQLDYLINFK